MKFEISTDPKRMQIDVIHVFLRQSYWARGISRERLAVAMEHSLCFGAFSENRQIGFARVLTDYSRSALLMDVFVLPEFQGRGVGKALLSAILNFEALSGVNRWLLRTSDAHGFYAQIGFHPSAHPERFMELLRFEEGSHAISSAS